MEVIKRLSVQPIRRTPYFFRTLKGVEVDLVLESGSILDAYEIKWTQSPEKSMISSLQVLAEEHPIRNRGVLSPVAHPLPIAHGISAIPWHSLQ